MDIEIRPVRGDAAANWDEILMAAFSGRLQRLVRLLMKMK